MIGELHEAGLPHGRDHVARLMRSAALRAKPRRQATAPNQKWVADFTYVWTTEGWLYVAAVLDRFSRRVVGWSMQPTMTSTLVTDALMMAVWRRGPADQLLHHSDQGSQCNSEAFQRVLASLGITCSMSRSGNCWDNAVMESFFSTLKTERCNRKHYSTRQQARADVFDYIERWYNPLRRHSTLGNTSPIKYKQAAVA
jgi:putative transposase